MSRSRTEALAGLTAALPDQAVQELFGMFAGGGFDPRKAEKIFAAVDWQESRPAMEELLRSLLPVDELVPDHYASWRSVVGDGFAFVAARLSPDRLLPKVLQQFSLPETTPLEERVSIFIARIPSLQKIGQTVARNGALSPELRARLSMLEEGIQEADPVEIHGEIERQLGQKLRAQQAEVEREIFAEGSVSALVRFTRRKAPPGEPRAGVLKVLKPFIPKYFREDLDALSKLADYFDGRQDMYDLEGLRLKPIVDSVRDLFLRETDFVSERAHMRAAAEAFSGTPGIRVPIPIDSLSTSTITAMTEEKSGKLTEACPGDPELRRDVARRLVNSLVAGMLFSPQDAAPFHADPHAGNLRLADNTADIVVLDWALTGTLSREERRSLVRLFIAIPLRDEDQMLSALLSLSDPETQRRDRALIKKEIGNFVDGLPPGTIPAGAGALGDLLDGVLRCGAQLPASFLIFRKTLSTLGDVVEMLSPGLTVGSLVADYALRNGLRGKCPSPDGPAPFALPLKASDVVAARWSAQFFLPRLLFQTLRRAARSSEKNK